MPLRSLTVYLLILTGLVFVSCRDEEEDAASNNGNDDPVPSGMTRLYGDARDESGQPVSDVALHVIYDTGGTFGPYDVQQTSTALFYYNGTPLTTECGGSTPIPDGVPISIIWDVDSDGPDDTDPLPPLCYNPPVCDDGPAQTVNRNQFAFNGEATFTGAGTFNMESAFTTIGEILTPNRFYLRVYCEDGEPLWTSEVVDIPSGAHEYFLTFDTCNTCSGIPVIPEWYLEQGYPNPVTGSATIPFGLEVAANALITLREASSGDIDTLLNDARGAGSHAQTFDMTGRANGLYEYRFSAGTFSDERTLLKNETNREVLRNRLPIDLTGAAGEYRFATAAGVDISLRSEANENQGSALLDHLRLIAIKTGYAIADTSITVVSAESLRVDLILHPE